MAKAAEEAVTAARDQVNVGIAGLIGLLLTLVISAVSVIAASKAVRAANSQVRAYLSVEPTILRHLEAGEVPTIDLKITNSGASPAYRVRHVAMLDLLQHPLVNEQGPLIIPGDDLMPKVTLSPKSWFVSTVVKESALTKEEIAKLFRNEDYRLYVAGTVFYRDVFKKEHSTMFCFFLGAPEIMSASKRLGGRLIEAHWSLSHVHNDAD